PDALATAFRNAGTVRRVLEGTKWDLFEAVSRLTDERTPAAQALRARLVEALSQDEYVVELARALPPLESEAVRLLTPAPVGEHLVEQGGESSLDAAGLAAVARSLGD